MPSQHCKRPVDLFRQDGAGEFMRHRHRRKRNQQIGAFAPRRGKAVMAADEEDQIVAQHFGFGEEIGEGG